jgi:hypothetical protein
MSVWHKEYINIFSYVSGVQAIDKSVCWSDPGEVHGQTQANVVRLVTIRNKPHMTRCVISHANGDKSILIFRQNRGQIKSNILYHLHEKELYFLRLILSLVEQSVYTSRW